MRTFPLRTLILSHLSNDYQWQELSTLGKKLLQNGVLYKQLGFKRLCQLLGKLSGYVELKIVNTVTGPVFWVRKHPMQESYDYKINEWSQVEYIYKATKGKKNLSATDLNTIYQQARVSHSASPSARKAAFRSHSPSAGMRRNPIMTSRSVWMIYTPMGNNQ